MKVNEVMTEKVIAVDSESRIDEVAQLLTEHRFHGLPVTEKGKLLGIVVEDDFFTKGSLSIHLPSYIDFLKKSKIGNTLDGAQKKDIENLFGVKARDIMTADCLTVAPEMDVMVVLDIFKKTGHKTFPVVDLEKRLLGIVTLADILKLF